jgi:hypothetical protein
VRALEFTRTDNSSFASLGVITTSGVPIRRGRSTRRFYEAVTTAPPVPTLLLTGESSGARPPRTKAMNEPPSASLGVITPPRVPTRTDCVAVWEVSLAGHRKSLGGSLS